MNDNNPAHAVRLPAERAVEIMAAMLSRREYSDRLAFGYRLSIGRHDHRAYARRLIMSAIDYARCDPTFLPMLEQKVFPAD